MKNYDEFLKRLNAYENALEELVSSSPNAIDYETLQNTVRMRRRRMTYFVETRIDNVGKTHAK